MMRHDIAKQLRQEIKRSGQSQHKLARRSGVDQGSISRFSRGERDLFFKSAVKLCKALKLKLVKDE